MSSTAVTHLSDSALMSRVAARDVDAFEAVYERYQSQAYGMAMRVAGRAGVAEEVTQDAFLNLWHNAGTYDPARGTLAGWLLTMVRFRGIDLIRSGARHDRNVAIDAALAARLESPERTDDQVVADEESEYVRHLLDDLPAEQRETVELAYFAGLSQSEIAARSGVPLGTVKGRLRLALAKLSRSLQAGSMLARTG